MTNSTARSDSDLQGGGAWRSWDGGICPVDSFTRVEYRLRFSGPDRPSGPTGDLAAMAGGLRWDHGRTPESAADASLRRNDIVAYRITPEQPA